MARTISSKKPKNLGFTLHMLFRYMGRHLALLLLVALLVTVSSVAGLLGTYMIRPIVNELAGGNRHTLLLGVLEAGGIFLVGVVTAYGYTQLTAEGGLLAGDMISKVDGRDVTQEELDIVVNNYVKGEENTEVTLTVFRPSVNDYLDITMTRKNVEVPTVEHQMLTGDIGYVLITQFEMVTAQQFKDAVKDLESQGMKKLMIDLRSNPGGVVDSAVSIAAYMLPEGDILTTRYKNGQEDVYRTKDKKLRVDSSQEGGFPQYPVLDEDELDIPIAILVNENSASASEILAGAMKDYGRATLVGTTTFGKGIVQNLYPLKDGSAIKMTVAKYFTPSGYDLHEKGIQPDVEVELDAELAARG